MDSELVVKQIQGLYRVKDATLADLNRQLDALIRRFDSFRVRHVRREANQRTDELANEALDGG
jgi:ribonuclease HI